MIQGRLSNNFIVASSSIQDLQKIQGDATIQRIRKNKEQEQKKAISYDFQVYKDEQKFNPMSHVLLDVDQGICLFHLNDQLTKPSYLQAVSQMPLPSKEIEERILMNQGQKKEEYKNIKQFQEDGMLDFGKSLLIEQNQVPQPGGDRQPGYIEKMAQNNNNNNDNKLEQDINEFIGFTMCQDRDVARIYVQKFPGDIQRQYDEYLKDKEKEKKDQENQKKIENFKTETGATAIEALRYIQKYPDIVTAIQMYKSDQEKQRVNEMVIQFKEITQETEEIARKFINKYNDVGNAVQEYEREKEEEKQRKIDLICRELKVDQQQSKFLLDAADWDVQSAKNVYKLYN